MDGLPSSGKRDSSAPSRRAFIVIASVSPATSLEVSCYRPLVALRVLPLIPAIKGRGLFAPLDLPPVPLLPSTRAMQQGSAWVREPQIAPRGFFRCLALFGGPPHLPSGFFRPLNPRPPAIPNRLSKNRPATSLDLNRKKGGIYSGYLTRKAPSDAGFQYT